MPKITLSKLFSDKFIFFLIVFLFLGSRLINLTQLPIFNDEAMYLNWSRLMVKDLQSNFFLPLTDGQQPFFVWLTALAFLINPNHFLFTGRFISVLAGLGTLIALYFIGKLIKNPRTGQIFMILYTLIPFGLFYDRLAIKDSFLFCLAAWIILFILKQFNSKKYVLPIGILLGLALLTKSIAYFFILLYPFLFLLFYLDKENSKKLSLKKVKLFFNQYGIQIILIVCIALLIQSIQYFSPLSRNIGPKNSVFLFSLKELLEFPISTWRNNLYSTVIWFLAYYSLPLLLVSLFGFFQIIKKRVYFSLAWLSWLVLPILFEILTAKIYIPRYFLFTQISMIVFAFFGFKQIFRFIHQDWLRFLILFFVMFLNIKFDYQILFDLNHAPLPTVEKWQYQNGWPSGYGLNELFQYLNNYQQKEGEWPVILTEQETLLSSSLPLYISNNNLNIQRIFTLDQNLASYTRYLDYLRANYHGSIIIILHHNQQYPADWPVTQIAKISRNDNLYFLVLKLNQDF